jgi:TetR/AcrR family transcriptional regulator, regulator of cefoperazone and chloramphenicol sensitivity
MKVLREDTARTRKCLLEAASEIFAEKGFRNATVAEICRRANANIAAVNYHFGDKETLYREAWRQSFLESLKAHPLDGGVSDNAPPEKRLRGQVTAFLHRITDRNNKEFLFVLKEFANPTGLLQEVMQEEIRPLQERTRVMIRELLGPHISDIQIRFCELSILSQCMNPVVMRSGKEGKREHESDYPAIDDVDAYADHVVRFSLGGICAVREQAKKKRRSYKKQQERGT